MTAGAVYPSYQALSLRHGQRQRFNRKESAQGWRKLGAQVNNIKFQQGSAVSRPLEDASLDGAFMMHVGMNIEDKHALISEVSRLLKFGARFGIYDAMKGNEE